MRVQSKYLRSAAAALTLFVLLSGSAAPARGQDAGIFRAPQGRRVGRVRLPTPPFNPDAGVLDKGRGRAHGSPKTSARRPPKRRVKSGRRVHRGRRKLTRARS